MGAFFICSCVSAVRKKIAGFEKRKAVRGRRAFIVTQLMFFLSNVSRNVYNTHYRFFFVFFSTAFVFSFPAFTAFKTDCSVEI